MCEDDLYNAETRDDRLTRIDLKLQNEEKGRNEEVSSINERINLIDLRVGSLETLEE